MPEEVDEEDGQRNRRAGSAEKTLSEFKTLSYEEQMKRRREWTNELEQIEDEISGNKSCYCYN